MDTFREYIHSLLSFTGVDSVDMLTSDEDMRVFETAFTHESFNKIESYDYLEKIGDASINLAIQQYIRQRFPSIVNISWLNRLYQKLKGKTFLAEIGRRLKLVQYVKMSKAFERKIEHNSIENDSLYEDLVESFMGAVTIIADEKMNPGESYVLVYNFVKNVFDEVHISLKVEDLWDPVTLVKELFDSRFIPLTRSNRNQITTKRGSSYTTEIKWWENVRFQYLKGVSGGPIYVDEVFISGGARINKGDPIMTVQVGDRTTTIRSVVYGQILNVKAKTGKSIKLNDLVITVSGGRLVRLASGRGSSEGESKAIAMKNAFYEIRSNKNIFRTMLTKPCKYTLKDIDVDLAIPPPSEHFAKFAHCVLHFGGVKARYIDSFLTEDDINIFHNAMIDKSFSEAYNNRILIFEGVPLFDYCMTTYIRNRYPHIKSDNELSRIGHQFMTGGNKLLNACVELGLDEFIVYDDSIRVYAGYKENTTYKTLIQVSLKALFGALKRVIDKTQTLDIGMQVSYNFICFLLDRLDIQTVDVGEDITRLKERYAALKWNTHKYMNNVYDGDTHLHTVTVHGFPDGEKILLATASNNVLKAAKRAAASEAINVLKSMGLWGKEKTSFSPTYSEPKKPKVKLTKAQMKVFVF